MGMWHTEPFNAAVKSWPMGAHRRTFTWANKRAASADCAFPHTLSWQRSQRACLCADTDKHTDAIRQKHSHRLQMQVFHFANLIPLSESGNVQLCGFVTHWARCHGESPRGVCVCVCVCVCEWRRWVHLVHETAALRPQGVKDFYYCDKHVHTSTDTQTQPSDRRSTHAHTHMLDHSHTHTHTHTREEV